VEEVLSKKSILIVSEYFYPEEFKINEVALEWMKRGYSVDVLTTVPTYPESKVYNGYENKFYQKETYRGINIYRVKAVTGYKTSFAKKLLKYFSFMFFATFVALKIAKRYNYIFGFDVGALTAMFPAILVKKLYKKRVVLWILDIWPDSVYAYGFKKTKLLSSLLDGFVAFIYNNSSALAVSSQGFKKKIKPYLKEEKEILYAPNWADELDEGYKPFSFSQDDKVHFTFAGNIGTVQNLDNVIKAFGKLDATVCQKAQLNIIGDGSYLETLKQLVEQGRISNVVFWGRKPRKEIQKYFQASDFLIVSLIDKPIFSLTVPAKVQTYIAAKKPILAILEGDAAKIVEENQLGYCASPDNILEIKKIFEKAIKNSDSQKNEFVKNCKYLTETIFFKKNIINDLLKLTVGVKS